jgi:Bacteriophage tail sheath protein
VGEPSYPGVYVDELPPGHTIEGVPTSTTAFVGSPPAGPIDTPVSIKSLVEFDRSFGPVDDADPTSLAVRLFFENGGGEAIVLRQRVGAQIGPALDLIDRFNLLCLPGLWGDGSPGDVPRVSSALEAASQACFDRRGVLLIDPSPGWPDPASAMSGPTSIPAVTASARGENAAAFLPALRVATRSGTATSGPAGAIAGLIARTDRERGVWKAPAGLEAPIVGTSGPVWDIPEVDAASLSDACLNTIRRFPDAGTVPWGARLLSGVTRPEPEWKYLPVRRLLLYVEESIGRGLQWADFEPNDELLWASVRRSVGAFLSTLFRMGALAGVKPEEAYFVKCDADTMTQADVDAGLLNVLIGIAPLRPSEFATIRIAHQRGGG